MKSEAMDEHFVGYLMNTLDPATHQRVAAYLNNHPEARARLEYLEQALEPLAADAEDEEPPPGLLLSTLARVSEYRCALPDAPPPPVYHPEAAPRRWGRPLDWLVAAVLLLLVGGLFLPMVASQWRAQQRLACENNLRQFWVALQGYADRSENAFPRVESEGPRAVAGIFVPILNDSGLLQDVSVACPAHGKQEPLPCSVAELERLYAEAPEEYRALTRQLAGHYAYSLGYEDGNALRGLRREAGDRLPILADRSGEEALNSPNHNGLGQNVLYVGGNVRWAVQPTVGVDCDNIYVNRNFRVRAGVSQSDTVLGASDDRPYQE